MDSMTAERPGLYDAPGWVEDRGILDILNPYLMHANFGDYVRFTGVPGSALMQVMLRVPVENMTDSQNDSPMFGDMVRIAEVVGAEAMGYVIRRRWDERVTIDGLFFNQDSLLHDEVAQDWFYHLCDKDPDGKRLADADAVAVWEWAQETYVMGACVMPSEVRIRPVEEEMVPGRPLYGLWLWWD